MTITGSQCREARKLLNWTHRDLSEGSGVSRRAVAYFEAGQHRSYPSTVTALQRALEEAGVEFAAGGSEPGSVRLKPGVTLVPGNRARFMPTAPKEVRNLPAILTPMQCKMSRAGLDWGLRELAQRSGVGIATVNRFEKGTLGSDHPAIPIIQMTFEVAGAVFLEDDGRGVGVRQKKSDVQQA